MSGAAFLLVDLGNTRLKWCYWGGGACAEAQRASYRDADLSSVLDQRWNRALVPQGVVVSSVAAEAATRELVAWVGKHWRTPVQLVRVQKESFGVCVAYADPEQLGVDRWLGLIAARRLTERPACIVDAGTAITIDALGVSGRHLGGLILPGFRLMRDSLLAQTNIPSPSNGEETLTLFARDTAAAVHYGGLYAGAALVERVVAAMRAELRAESELLLTGGDATRLELALNLPARRVPDLVIQGLAVVARQGGSK